MNEQNQSDEISIKELIVRLKEWLDYLMSKWKIIFLVSLIGGLLGLGYSLLQKPTYTASLSFALEEDGGGGGGVLSLASQFGFDLGTSGGGAFTGSNLIELFKSRSMVEKTLLAPVKHKEKIISLAEMYIEINKLNEGWEKNPKLKNIRFLPNTSRVNFTREQDSILGTISSSLQEGQLNVLQKDKKIDIIFIDVKSGNELFAKYFCESLAKEVSEFYVVSKSKKARMNLEILQHQTDSIRRVLNEAITGVAVATDNTFNLNPALNVRRTPSVKRQIDVQANTAILTEIVKQLALAKVTFRKETPLIQIIDRPILPLAKDHLSMAKGIVIGGLLAGFLVLIFLVFNGVFKSLTK
jgi:hypothetical protein